jgi:hypothetical protein
MAVGLLIKEAIAILKKLHGSSPLFREVFTYTADKEILCYYGT